MDQHLIEVDPFKNLCKIFIVYELDTTPITLSLIKIKCLCLKLLIRFIIILFLLVKIQDSFSSIKSAMKLLLESLYL